MRPSDACPALPHGQRPLNSRTLSNVESKAALHDFVVLGPGLSTIGAMTDNLTTATGNRMPVWAYVLFVGLAVFDVAIVVRAFYLHSVYVKTNVEWYETAPDRLRHQWVDVSDDASTEIKQPSAIIIFPNEVVLVNSGKDSLEGRFTYPLIAVSHRDKDYCVVFGEPDPDYTAQFRYLFEFEGFRRRFAKVTRVVAVPGQDGDKISDIGRFAIAD